MLPTERKQRILTYLKEHTEASVQGLSRLLDAPAASIRRDLRDLESENRIFRKHGKAIYRPTLVAATLEPDSPLSEGSLDALVSETAQVLSEARNLFLTGGPALLRVVRALTGKTIVTHDLRLALAAAEADNDVSLVGRAIDNKSLTLRPGNLEEDLRDYWFDVAVVEADGLDSRSVFVSAKDHGILPAVNARTDSLVVVGKSNLVGRRGDRVAAAVADVDVLLIDAEISGETEKTFERSGVELRKTGNEGEADFDVNSVGNVYVFKNLGTSPFLKNEEE